MVQSFSLADNKVSILDYLNNRIDVLRKAQTQWAASDFSYRSKPLGLLRELISSEADRIASVIAAENGKSKLEALTQEVIPSLDVIDYLENHAEKILSDTKVKLPTKQFYFGKKTYTYTFRPYGVVGILGTWNYAFYLSLSQVLFALAAGNAVILKGSPLSRQVTEEISDLLKASGFDEDLFEIFSGQNESGEALTQSNCDKYILTGSKQTGRKVMKVLGERLKPAVMELSGCDSFTVFKDSDLELAAKTLIWASCQYSGQTCVAPRRVLIETSAYDEFKAILKNQWEASQEFISEQGVLRDVAGAAHQAEQIKQLIQAGSRRFLGEDSQNGSYIAPSFYEGSDINELRDKDFMCPVAFLFKFTDEEDVVRQANNSVSALAASIWTSDSAKAGRLARQIRCGQLWVNDAIFSVAMGSAGFGGFGDTGFGKTRGEEGLLEMAQKTLVCEDYRAKRSVLHLPPYDKKGYGILLALQKFIFRKGFKAKLKAMIEICQSTVKRVK